MKIISTKTLWYVWDDVSDTASNSDTETEIESVLALSIASSVSHAFSESMLPFDVY